MPTCLHFDDRISDEAVCCSNYGVAHLKVTSEAAPTSPNESSSNDMSARLEKAMKRAELLSYAAAGLAVAILVVIIGIAFLPR
jgi:hypothetical protein